MNMLWTQRGYFLKVVTSNFLILLYIWERHTDRAFRLIFLQDYQIDYFQLQAVFRSGSY